MHCGFYEELDKLKEESEFVDGFNFLENIYVELSSDPYASSSVYDYLHGMCYEFATYLHLKMGYPLVTVWNPDEVKNKLHVPLIHAFCIDNRFKKPLYIDARGITDDPIEFWSEFENFCSYDPTTGKITYFDFYKGKLDCPVEITERIEELFEWKYKEYNNEPLSQFLKDYPEYFDTEYFHQNYRSLEGFSLESK